MLIDAGCGGRIVSLKSNRHELLLQDSINPINYGSTLWLSPQNWGGLHQLFWIVADIRYGLKTIH